MKKENTILKVEKGWGYELWIHNDEKYCGKLLFFNKDKRCSFHKHLLKTETFYLQSGKILLKYGYENDIGKAKELILFPGQKFEIPINLNHQMIALENSELFEFSTEHFDSDSCRVVKGD
jgi:mannose-6-phosphate isomerase-like protein (cupin superfamily)